MDDIGAATGPGVFKGVGEGMEEGFGGMPNGVAGIGAETEGDIRGMLKFLLLGSGFTPELGGFGLFCWGFLDKLSNIILFLWILFCLL